MSAPDDLFEAFKSPATYAKIRLGLNLHPVQSQVLEALFRPQSRISFRCGNEVGKTSIIATVAVLYGIEVLDCNVISTSGSWIQILEQLIPNLKRYQESFPDWSFQSSTISLRGVNRYVGLSTNSEGTFQGKHNLPGHDLLMVIDEAAAVPDGIFNAAEERCNPRYFIAMGSPLDPVGRFYDIETKSSRFYTHFKLGQMDCTVSKGFWIPDEVIARKIEKYGAEHPLILSNVFAEFAKSTEGGLLSLREFEACIETPPDWLSRSQDRHAFIDVAGGGDQCVFAARVGNKCWIEKKWREANEMASIGECIAIFNKLRKDYGFEQCEVSIDAGGLGKPMAARLDEVGYRFNRFLSQAAPRYDEEYGNLIAEVWSYGAAKIKKREIIIPDDEDFKMQILQRTISRRSTSKFYIESKEDLRKAARPSPDEADALLGCIFPCPMSKSVSTTRAANSRSRWDTDKDEREEFGVREYFS